MKDLFQVLTLKDAQKTILNHWSVPERAERVKLDRALQSILAGDIYASLPVPGFHRSTVDGYAVRAADTFGASESMPALFSLKGEILMGVGANLTLKANETCAIATGGMLPPDADAVVMIEYTELLDQNTIEVMKSVAPGDNVLRKGEDMEEGSLAVPRGTRIGPYQMGLAAAAGYDMLEVKCPLQVGVISTGEELVGPDVVPEPGQVRDINSYCLAGLIEQSGGKPTLYGIIRDNKTQLAQVLDRAVEENDMVVISGGSSVGVRDMTLDVLSQGLLFHGIAVRPGKPTLAAIIKDKLVFGLPGHPASAAISFYLLVHPLLETGDYRENSRVVWATLGRNLASGPGREDYVRVKLSSYQGDTVATPILGKSGLISTLASADGLIRIPLHKEGLCAGERVEVILL